ncbi:MAG TPA: hypothetical protein VJ576_11040 [Rhodocyclaceae bacterium]|nr:hypothetical protein [Rhodocyclaceae bacterium]
MDNPTGRTSAQVWGIAIGVVAMVGLKKLLALKKAVKPVLNEMRR